MSEHTPLPWKVKKYKPYDEYSEPSFSILTAPTPNEPFCAKTICDMHTPIDSNIVHKDILTEQANAEYIVKAANNYPRLVELTKCLEGIYQARDQFENPASALLTELGVEL